jgi:hypothetical protein
MDACTLVRNTHRPAGGKAMFAPVYSVLVELKNVACVELYVELARSTTDSQLGYLF